MSSVSISGAAPFKAGNVAVAQNASGALVVEQVFEGDDGSLVWQELGLDSPAGVIAIEAYQQYMARSNDYAKLIDYRHSTLANWTANLAVHQLAREPDDRTFALYESLGVVRKLACTNPDTAFSRMAELGIEQSGAHLARAEAMLANAEVFKVTPGALSALNEIRNMSSPAGAMFSADEQLSSIARQHPELMAQVPNYNAERALVGEIDSTIARLEKASKDFLNSSAAAMYQAEKMLNAEVSARELLVERFRTHYLGALWAAREAIAGINSKTPLLQAGITSHENPGSTTVFFPYSAFAAPGTSNAEIDAWGDMPVAVANLPSGTLTRETLYAALSASIADRSARVAQSFDEAVRRDVTLPKGHEINSDLVGELRFSKLTRSNDFSIRISTPDHAGEKYVAVDVRIFFDRPKAVLFADLKIHNEQSQSLVSEADRHIKASTYSELIPAITERLSFIMEKSGLELTSVNSDEPYLISVETMKYTQDEIEAGEGGSFEWYTEPEAMDAEQVARLIRHLGIYESDLQVSHEGGQPKPLIRFRSTTPDENREFFEDSISTFYTLNVLEFEGKPLTVEQGRAFADGFGLSYDEQQVDSYGLTASKPVMGMGN